MRYDYKLSVLVTFCNQKEYVDRALESIISQNVNFDYEIVIGDDSSTDGTKEILDRWKCSNPNHITIVNPLIDDEICAPGFRASQNRLQLLKYVKGEYFTFLDGDDYYCDSSKFQIQIDLLDRDENQKCVGAGHLVSALLKDGSISDFGGEIGREERIISSSEYWRKYYMHTDTLIFRSKYIDTVDHNELKYIFNDNMITFSFIKYGGIYYIPKAMAIYDNSTAGLWTSGKKVINAIRNMYMIDACACLNSGLKRESMKRFAPVWACILDVRKDIGYELNEYKKCATECGFANSLEWINYNELRVYKKCLLIVKAVYYAKGILIERFAVKIYHFIKGFIVKDISVDNCEE